MRIRVSIVNTRYRESHLKHFGMMGSGVGVGVRMVGVRLWKCFLERSHSCIPEGQGLLDWGGRVVGRGTPSFLFGYLRITDRQVLSCRWQKLYLRHVQRWPSIFRPWALSRDSRLSTKFRSPHLLLSHRKSSLQWIIIQPWKEGNPATYNPDEPGGYLC